MIRQSVKSRKRKFFGGHGLAAWRVLGFLHDLARRVALKLGQRAKAPIVGQ